MPKLNSEIMQVRKRKLFFRKLIKILKTCKGKGKAFPLQNWTDPWGSRRLRLQNV
jgi:hypothetical protein